MQVYLFTVEELKLTVMQLVKLGSLLHSQNFLQSLAEEKQATFGSHRIPLGFVESAISK